jgi:acetylornithine deacetylase/succinyl-diaminopimelate desuccinylase-like protein
MNAPHTYTCHPLHTHTLGYQEQVVELMVDWVKQQDVKGLEMRVEKIEGRTPLIFMVIEGEQKTEETILLYGHYDKQVCVCVCV